MNWRIAGAVVAGLILASLADWVFAGVLFHDRYQTYPEVWRVNGANPRALIAAQALTLPTVAGFVALVLWTGRASLEGALILAGLVWAIAAAPAIIANGLFIKIDARVVASHALGWLVKLALVASSTAVIVHS
jgi:hypothetical protein